MLEVVLVYVIIKQITGYYISNEHFRESLWKKQIWYSLLGWLFCMIYIAVNTLLANLTQQIDFTAAAFLLFVCYWEYVLLGWIKTIRRSVGHVILNNGRDKMNKALLMSRTFIAVFSLYLVIVLVIFLMVGIYKSRFTYF